VKHIKFLLVCLVALFSINAHSLQLGKIIFKSNQNSPLDVSIQVNLSSEDKISQLKPSIASKENYDSQGIERTKIHNDIVMSLVSKNSNQASLRLTSKIPVTEPFLDLLIQIESPSGKILKEYTVLLDPPINLVSRKKIEEKKVIQKEVIPKNKPEKIKKIEEKKVIQKEAKNQASKKRKTVKAIQGKTLFQIARENSIAGITTEQIVISIYQLNPNAFDGNLNGLIKGKVLKLPLRDYFRKLSHLEARKILKRENIAWKKITRKQKSKNINNNLTKNKRDSDELSRLKKELEIANKKLLEKDQALKAVEKSTKSIIEQKAIETKAPEIIPDQINGVREEQSINESNAFISSVTDQNENIIEEIIIDDEGNNDSIKPVFVLLLVFLLTLLIGLLFIVRKRKKEINTDHFSGLSETSEPKSPEVDQIIKESHPTFDDLSHDNSVNQGKVDDTGSVNHDSFHSDSNRDNEPR